MIPNSGLHKNCWGSLKGEMKEPWGGVQALIAFKTVLRKFRNMHPK